MCGNQIEYGISSRDERRKLWRMSEIANNDAETEEISTCPFPSYAAHTDSP